MSHNWRGGSTRRWRRIRAGILHQNLINNCGECQLKLDSCEGQATQVHHTEGRGVTGDDPRYLVATCGACNRQVGDPTKAKPRPIRFSRW